MVLPARFARLRGASALVGALVLFLFIIQLFDLAAPLSESALRIEPDDGGLGYTAVLLYLIEPSRMEVTAQSLGLQQRNIPWRRQWPIVLFHTGDYNTQASRNEFWDAIRESEWTKDVYQELVDRVEFVQLEFTLPPGMPDDVDVYKPQVSADRWPGEFLSYFARWSGDVDWR